jgi:3-oxoacyl-[acyl-carrier-protein] synthase III
MRAQREWAPGHARILGIGGYLPRRVVPNREFCERLDCTEEWIVRRSGIRERRFAAPDETVPVMAHAAATKALAAAGVEPGRVSCVITATMTHLRQAPAAAAEVAEMLGAGANVAAGFDLNAACAGFCYGVALAGYMVGNGSAEYVLVIGAERMSDIIDPADRGAAFLFGDGAGAAVIGHSDQPGIGPVVWGSDSARGDAIVQPLRWPQLRERRDAPWPYLDIAGPAVFRWAVTSMDRVCREALDAAGVAPADLAAFIPHQANLRITEALVSALRLPPSVAVARDVEEVGNTSAASVPLALDRMLSRSPATSGGLALIVGFGAGLLYAAEVVRLP